MKAVYRREGGEPREVSVEAHGPDAARVRAGGLDAEFTVVRLGPGRFRLIQGDRSWQVCVDAEGTRRHVTVAGVGEARFEKESAGRRRKRESSGGGLSSPMPGTVVKVLVAAGDSVAKGDDLLVVEAMKMEIKITAPVAGAVKSVNAVEGDPCDAGQVLAEIEPAAAG